MTSLIGEVSLSWALILSLSITFTTTLTYTIFNYIDHEGLRYWIISFLLNIALLMVLTLYLQNTYQTLPIPASEACRDSIYLKCQARGSGNVNLPKTCIEDGSIIREVIPYNLTETSNTSNTKVICS